MLKDFGARLKESVRHKRQYAVKKDRATASILIVICLIFAAWAVITLLDGSLICLGGCESPSGGGWTYEKGLSLLDSKDPFTHMVSYKALGGDVGAVGRLFAPYVWYLPLLPPALFLMIVVRSFSTLPSPSVEQNLVRWLGGIVLMLLWTLPYLLIAVLGVLLRTDKGWMVVGSVASASVATGMYQFWRFRSASQRYSLDELEGHRHPARACLLLILSVLAGSALNGCGALLVRDTYNLLETFNALPLPGLTRDAHLAGGAPARLFEAVVQKGGLDHLTADQVEGLEDLISILSREDILADLELLPLRRAMEKITSTNPPRHNIVSQNLCRSGWYIVGCSVCLILMVALLGRRCGRSKLAFVLTTYLAVGVVFGIIYYDYFILDTGRYHLLIDTIFVDDAAALKKAAASCGGCGGSLRQKMADIQIEAPDNAKLLSVIHSGFFASSVFAQDTPQIAVESDPPERLSTVFAGNYQFGLREVTINPDQALFYAREHIDDVGSCADSVAERLGYGPRQSSASSGVQTNRWTSVQLAEVLCREFNSARERTHRDYEVRVVGAADCVGSPDVNENYARRRGVQVLREAQRILQKVQASKGAPDSNSNRLMRAFDRATVTPPVVQPSSADLVECRPEEYRDLIWLPLQRGDAQREAGANELRAALVEISRRSLDVVDRVHMANGLTRSVTLSDMVYFSFVSFTTTGYGDIKAVSGPVRFCVIMENILEILFTAIFFTAAMAIVRQE